MANKVYMHIVFLYMVTTVHCVLVKGHIKTKELGPQHMMFRPFLGLALQMQCALHVDIQTQASLFGFLYIYELLFSLMHFFSVKNSVHCFSFDRQAVHYSPSTLYFLHFRSNSEQVWHLTFVFHYSHPSLLDLYLKYRLRN